MLAMDGVAAKTSTSFLKEHEAKLQKLETVLTEAWWVANTTGKEEDFAKKEKAQNELDSYLTQKKVFTELQKLKASITSDTPNVLKRQIELAYLQAFEKQVPEDLLKKISKLANEAERKFNVYRANVQGKDWADSQVREVLKSSPDSELRKNVWTASKGIGKEVEKVLAELVEVRNEVAKKLGYKNYIELQLFLAEQSVDDVLKLFDDLDKLTEKPFQKAKAEIDAHLANKFKIKPEELMPWHYEDPYFQEAPNVEAHDWDQYYKSNDIVKLTSKFYQGVGLPVDSILSKSDLYERKGKSPHAFCSDMNREGDERVLANIVPKEYWMSTMLHELGHGVYSSVNIPKSLPYILRGESHILTTEGVAMLFQKFSRSGRWLNKMGILKEGWEQVEKAGKTMIQREQLVFSRWCQVMFRFEKGMYENPKQNLGDLWWKLVEKYQGIKKPKGRNEPDYASKIHVVSAPAYYHNYMMGELFASQVLDTVSREVLHTSAYEADFVGKPAIGKFFKERVFAPGRTLNWRDLTKYISGKDLNPEAFAKSFQ